MEILIAIVMLGVVLVFVGIADLYNASVVDWGMIMAAGTLVLLPVLAVFVFIQRYLVAGWGTGGIKG